MQLDVTEDQLEVLEELVNERISSLGTEIRHCDNRDYRQRLADKRDHLRSLSSALRDLSAPRASSV